jgi:UDPglucose 6-dehydrogenase
MGRFLRRSDSIRLHVYDRFIPDYAAAADFEAVNRSEVVFIAVPTPYDTQREACDVSIVAEVVGELSTSICIKSTIPPGTTDALIARTGKRICFSPEYIGEAPGHPWPEIDGCGFVVFGGDSHACAFAQAAYEAAARPDLRYFTTSALTAELGKYMENAYLASKVTFVNQFYDLAAAAGVDFEELRTMFLLDSRVGESHTTVSRERGFGGKCLPKDLQAIVAWARERDCPAIVLEAILAYNESARSVTV